MKSKILILIILIGLTGVIILSYLIANTSVLRPADGEIPHVFVSILPQKYFVERIADDTVRVSVMVQPGHSPETYEPMPRQMADLSTAAAYFRIGMPFETSWMNKIQAVNANMRIVDTREGIELREFDGHHHHEGDTGHLDSKDPHIWLSPELVKQQAKTMCDALIELYPDNAEFYRRNLEQFTLELSQLSEEIRETLKDLPTREFMVFHPSWGYFADEFGLVQIPIEVEGKEPTAKELADIVELAKEKSIKVIFVQSQFSTSIADRVAESIGGKVVSLDPLAEDYVSNLRTIASCFAKELR